MNLILKGPKSQHLRAPLRHSSCTDTIGGISVHAPYIFKHESEPNPALGSYILHAYGEWFNVKKQKKHCKGAPT